MRRGERGNVGVQDQEYRQIEHVIIGDGLTDGTIGGAARHGGRAREFGWAPSIELVS